MAKINENLLEKPPWTYTATQAPVAGEALRIVARATDLPGNEAVLEVAIP